jgi:aspartate racemase
MKTLGIVGGIGPESTIEYYRFIIAEYRARTQDDSYPHILIDSIDVSRGVALVQANDMDGLAAYVGAGFERLAHAGADFGLMAANTPHIAFDAIQQRSPVPLLSIVQATCDHAKKNGMTRLALLGTGFTMRGRFYPDVFSRAGIELVIPRDEELAYIHDKYLNELLKNVFLPETRARMLEIVGRMERSEGIQGVSLAGTELPLILRDPERKGVPFLETTLIHVNAAVDEIVRKN